MWKKYAKVTTGASKKLLLGFFLTRLVLTKNHVILECSDLGFVKLFSENFTFTKLLEHCYVSIISAMTNKNFLIRIFFVASN